MNYDDFESSNPLSSNAGRQFGVSAFYYNFPTLPYHAKEVKNIFVAMFMKSEHLKKFGPNKSLAPLIDKRKLLEEERIV